MDTDTPTLIKALRILVEDIQSDDGVANACIAEAADRLELLYNENLKMYDKNLALNHIINKYKDLTQENNIYSFKEYSEINEAVLDQEIEGGSGKGKKLGSKETGVDDHLSAMKYHSNEYQKALKAKDNDLAQHHGRKYHQHKDQIERMGSQGDYKKD
jgi:multimeric flavodoxin WrbA